MSDKVTLVAGAIVRIQRPDGPSPAALDERLAEWVWDVGLVLSARMVPGGVR